MIYLTVYLDSNGDAHAHAGAGPLEFLRHAAGQQLDRVLYRAVIDGEIVEHDTNNE
ncbi:MAG TPA: hypothetical protein VLK79_16580 [Gaiellales bacterium]|nr:hypothetical protein [Gaiellales bacterium]